MRNSLRILSCAAAVSLGGCIYYVQAPPGSQAPVADTYVPPPSPAPAPVPAPEPAPVIVTYQPPPPEVAPVYQDDLAPYGRWFIHPRYGRCWLPNGVPYGWQPYTVGHWVYTDQGCCWVAEDQEVAWGGIVYHYGQWEYTPDMGWIWVPGTTWAPAWVAWRDGGGYCGWTPLPPECAYQPQVTVVVINQYCPPDRFVYVNEVNINDRRADQRIIRNNVTVINNTTNITNITVVNNRVVNVGVPAAEVERRTGRQVERVTVAQASTPDEARRLAASGTPVRLNTPAIEQVHAQQVQIHDQQVHDAQLQNQLNREKQVGQRDQVELNNQEKKDQQLQQQQQDAKARQAQLDNQHQQEQATHDKDVEAQRQAAQQKQAEHDQQIAAQKQAEHDRAVQQAQDAEAARQAAKDKADAAAAEKRQQQQQQQQQGKQGNKNPKPGQPNEPQQPQ